MKAAELRARTEDQLHEHLLHLKKEQFILGPSFTPSGVVRIAHLQAKDHYVYIKP